MKLNIKNAGAQRYRIFLDDEELLFCFEADEEAGEVKCYETSGPKGREEIVCDYDDNDKPTPRVVTRKGKVVIRKVESPDVK
jgi:hypothetical protein